METQPRNEDGATVAVVTGVIDVLEIEARIDASPGVESVVHLGDILSPIVEPPISEQKSKSAERQIFLMVTRNAIRNECGPQMIQVPTPALAVSSETKQDSLVDLCVRIGFVLPFVPSPTTENSEPVIQVLFEIDSESILNRRLQGVSSDFWRGRRPIQEIIHSCAIDAHVGVVHKREKA